MLHGRSKSRRAQGKLDDLVAHLNTRNHQQAFILLQSVARQPEITDYFKDLHLYATSQIFCTCQKYEALSDGVYVLLRGEVGYLLGSHLPKRQRHKRSKSHGITDARSIIISQPLTIFDSASKNCTAYEETFLLRITPAQAGITAFEEGRSRRRQLYESHYLSQDHYRLYSIPPGNRVLRADPNIHSIFHFAKYTFRQIIKLTSPAIVSEGRAKLKVAEFITHEFDQFGVLLPNLKYEVTSSTLSLMVISNHESVTYCFDLSLLKSLKNGPTVRKQNQPLKSASLAILKHQSIVQDSKRQKQLAKVSKQIANYAIFPTFLCPQKFNCAAKPAQAASKAIQKKVGFHQTVKQCHQKEEFGCITPQKSSRMGIAKQSSSLYQTISSSNSTKYMEFFGQLKASPSDGHILTKIRSKLRQQEKNRSVFTFGLESSTIKENYKGCLSQQ